MDNKCASIDSKSSKKMAFKSAEAQNTLPIAASRVTQLFKTEKMVRPNKSTASQIETEELSLTENNYFDGDNSVSIDFISIPTELAEPD